MASILPQLNMLTYLHSKRKTSNSNNKHSKQKSSSTTTPATISSFVKPSKLVLNVIIVCLICISNFALRASCGKQPVCGYPGSPAHATVSFSSTPTIAGTSASYTCDNSYELLGPPRRVCQANGTWTPPGIPFCVLNVGLGKAAMQSSTSGHGSAQKAVDGMTSQFFQSSTCTKTDNEAAPWWYVNLLEPYLVQIVRIDFGAACCGNRQKATVSVRVGNNRPDLGTNPVCNTYTGFIEEGKPLFLPCTRPSPGAFVSIHLESPTNAALSICETFIYTDHALSIEQCPSFRDQPLGSTATYNGKCYLFHSNQALNFDSARAYCESRGGSLVDETSPALQGFLSWELYRRHRNDQLMGQYWLGATRDAHNSNNWRWINGRDVQVSFWNSATATAAATTQSSIGNCSRFDGSKGWLWTDTDCQAQLNFICQYRPLSCGKPEKPTNSTLVTRNHDAGTVIEYQCAPGSLLMGPRTRTCLPTGFFSEFAPKCKYLDCQLPASITAGSFTLLNGTTSYKSLVQYACADGHAIVGKSVLACDVDERWNGPPPRCEPLLCATPVSPSNGYVTVTANVTTVGTQATFDCRLGYELVGERLLTCTPAGAWDNSFPYCKVDKRRLRQPQPQPQLQAPQSAFSSNRISNVAAPPLQSPHQQQQQPSTTASATSAATPLSSSSSSSTTTTTLAANAHSNQNSWPATLNGLAGMSTPMPTVNGKPAINSNNNNNGGLDTTSVVGPPLVFSPLNNEQAPPHQSNSPQLQLQPQLSPTQLINGGDINLPPTTATSNSRQNNAAQSSSVSHIVAAPDVTHTAGQSALPPAPPVVTLATPSALPTAQVHSHPATHSPPLPPHRFTPPSLLSPQQTSSNSIIVNGAQQTLNNQLAIQSSTTNNNNNNLNNNLNNNNNKFFQTQSSEHFANHHSSLDSANSLANAKHSLNGIIFVGIAGVIIFIGSIITAMVLLIRRKGSHSSSIDAQTISTYESHVENNGLYRNYQQAWDNLRFTKSGGNGGGGGNVLSGAHHLNAAAAAGLKSANFNAPIQMALAAQHAAGGHHNLALSASTASSETGDDDTAFGPNTNHRQAPHYRPQQVIYDEDEDDDDELDDDDDDNTDVNNRNNNSRRQQQQHRHLNDDTDDLSDSDHHQMQRRALGEREINELTLNAPTASSGRARSATATVGNNSSQQQQQHYASNAVVCSVNEQCRRSVNLAPQQQHMQHKRHNSHSSNQLQRLVHSSTPSNSTHSSDELEQLAYGRDWQLQASAAGGCPSNALGTQATQTKRDSTASSNGGGSTSSHNESEQSAASNASMLRSSASRY